MPKVLLVDDDRNVVILLKTLLQLEKFTVALESRAEEVLPTIRREQPDIVLMDISMPYVDGLEATREIMRLNQRSGVVALTMHESEEQVYLIIEAGAAGYVPKRAVPSELLTAIRAVQRATSRRITAAGGITTQREIDDLHALGIDAVVGMAIYTGALDPDAPGQG